MYRTIQHLMSLIHACTCNAWNDWKMHSSCYHVWFNTFTTDYVVRNAYRLETCLIFNSYSKHLKFVTDESYIENSKTNVLLFLKHPVHYTPISLPKHLSLTIFIKIAGPTHHLIIFPTDLKHCWRKILHVVRKLQAWWSELGMATKAIFWS
jgi:hypothetical protein